MSQGIFKSLASYVNYCINSKTKYKVHSPFVYELITQVFEGKDRDESCIAIHQLYRELSRNSRVLETTDFGARKGKASYVTRFLKVSSIAKGSSVQRKEGELLYRLVKYFHPAVILELGTSLGISTLYLSKAAPEAMVVSMEGCAAKVEVARANFGKLHASNIEVSTGRFDNMLPGVLKRIPSPDLVFIDGHHAYKPTLEYFEEILKHSHEDTVIILDDIHWSAGMEKAWREIKHFEAVTVTIDLYDMGLVFLKRSLSKQNFVIRY